ncbi:hypothetical protein EYM_06725 [Ignicoccus islandicus DSM 13165]|uniref:Uncharacterized protein n=1 Tax=Ignicoccus islandicus DSM 13165 TaxID=940295 RepID=A0A0U3E464_9CREN|nr:hypothetical protein EYM_06725 [Ignicoccus islandicus DSM 13165]
MSSNVPNELIEILELVRSSEKLAQLEVTETVIYINDE